MTKTLPLPEMQITLLSSQGSFKGSGMSNPTAHLSVYCAGTVKVLHATAIELDLNSQKSPSTLNLPSFGIV
jgi:hypothetical protein